MRLWGLLFYSYGESYSSSPYGADMPLDDRPPPYSLLPSDSHRSTSVKKSVILKAVFIGTAIFASLLLVCGVILGAVSLDVSNAKKFSVSAGILTLLGVMMLIATVPCCFYFWFSSGSPRTRSSTNSSRASSVCEVDRPSIVSDLVPEEFRIACTGCQAGNCRAAHSELPPPYDAPPPYSIQSETEDQRL